MRHGSLFSGIGGFDLASEWMGWDNVFHCEWAEFPRKILEHYWPNADSYGDITKTDFNVYRGTIDILTGGFPCQPYSQAGKRKGKDDDRHLWPHMLRAIREIKPRWVVGENVFGLTNWNGGVVLEEVCAELEAEGYSVQPFIIPAAAVGAPHRRDRVWIVAYSVSTGTRHQEHPSCNQEWGTCGNREKSLRQTHGTPSASGANATSANDAFAPYSESLGLGEGQQEAGRERAERQQQGSQVRSSSATTSQEWIASDTDNTGDSALRGGTDGNWTQSSEQRKQSFSEPSRPCDTGIASDTNGERDSSSGKGESIERNWSGNDGESKEWGEQTEWINGLYGFQWDATNPNRNGLNKRNGNDEVYTSQGRQYAQRDTQQSDEHGNTAYTSYERLQGGSINGSAGEIRSKSYQQSSRRICTNWEIFPTQPPVCGGDDGIPTELDGITLPKWRRESIKGYGNAIVPQVALQIFNAIKMYEEQYVG